MTRLLNHFNIGVSRLDGTSRAILAIDQNREINHARVSPDHEWITFTRYNAVDATDGSSMEIHGVWNTSIMKMAIDGSSMTTLVAAAADQIACNGYWTPDGTGVIYISLESGGNLTLRIVNATTLTRSVQPTPVGSKPSDPHIVGSQIVFASKYNGTGPEIDTIWISNVDGTNARQLTFPKTWGGAGAGAGDYDPKLSPDGLHVALMRRMGPDEWHTIVINVATGLERAFTAPGQVDGVPEWSSDGRLLIFWHVDVSDLSKVGLWTLAPLGTGRWRLRVLPMRRDGLKRTKVPLLSGYYYTMPAFYPSDGSGPASMIIWSAANQQQAFVTMWRTTAASESITLPLISVAGYSYNFSVDWGDGTSGTVTAFDDTDRIHTYAVAGDYDVSITGAMPGWSFSKVGDYLKCRIVKNWGQVGLKAAGVAFMFYGCSNLTVTATDIPDMGAVTTFAGMFWECSAVTTIPSMGSWNTANVTDMQIMFTGATLFNEDISGWNTANVTTFRLMFFVAAAFNQNISGWNTSSVTSMEQAFQYASAFNQNLGGWDISDVTNMLSMLNSTAMSSTNYSDTLIGWAAQTVQPSITIDAAPAQYNASGLTARNILTGSPNNWSITDGGAV